MKNLIAMCNVKIEALKQHKKGLMQQLFPNVVSKVGIADQFREGTKLIEQERH